MKTLFSIILLSLVSACAIHEDPSATPLPIVAPDQEVVIPKSLMSPCPTMNALPVQTYNQGQSLDQVKAWQDQYTSCRNIQIKLIQLTAKAFNIQDPTIDNTISIPSTSVKK